MRARRLRRLGLIGGDASSTATSSVDNPSHASTTAELTDNLAKSSTNTAAKNICPEFEERDDSQHKQKLQKFDNEVDMEYALNNNVPFTLRSPDAKTVSNHLTQRSRLLDEIEKQRIENKLNQNESKSTELTRQDVDMESDDSAPNKSTEGDSGIENMETDELPAAVESSLAPKPVAIEPVLLTPEAKTREAEICLSRILDAFWLDHCEGSIIVSETAAFYKDVVIDEEIPIQFDDLAFQIISEIVAQYFDGKRIDFKASGSDSTSKSQLSGAAAAGGPERMDTSEASSCLTTPNLKPHNLPDHGALTYLIQSYLRCCQEQERYSTAKNRQKFDSTVLDVVAQVKKLLISSAKLLLNGTLVKQLRSSTHAQTHRSVLLKMLYDDTVPLDFLFLLVEESHNEPKIFAKIFGTLIQNLYVDMQSRVVSKNIDTSPINILKQLLEITVNGNIRPICNLVCGLQNFCPTLCTATQGREIVKASYLGPFLSLSVFSEENPKLAEDVDENWEETFGNSLRMVCTFINEYPKNTSKNRFYFV